ncbi:phosphoadenosine phosphosulfate reductase family protein [[Clostridium] innocuum]|nr:phosphoadenosine phosphosulfate reductase family protein [[Clostridium] innocuum]
MKYIVSLSGGIGSYFTLKRVLNKFDKEDVIPVFCDTLAEDGDLYRFLNDIEKQFEIEIIRLCTGETPTTLCFKERFLFNSRVASCSKKLKSQPFRRYLNEHFKTDEAIIFMGIDFTETHRCKAITKNYEPYKVEFPMCEKPYLYKHEMLDELISDGIVPPRLYRLGFSHNNCGGRCFKAGIGHYKNLLEKDRNRYLEWENQEDAIRNSLGKDVSMMKRKGKPFTLKELRIIVENSPEQLSLFECQDIGGCGCFVEESE